MTVAPPFEPLLSRAIVGLDDPRAADSVATASLRRLAGRPAIAVSATLAPSDADTRPPTSRRARACLQTLIDNGPEYFLVEALRSIAARNRRIPFDLLPPLLTLTKKQHLAEPIFAAIGQRGRWLAERNPDWIPRSPDDPALWETGTPAIRADWLRRRRQDDPSAGRVLLEQGIRGEPAGARARLLQALEVGLGPDDEPFLERMLDDGSREVRSTAADLLASLVNSAFVARMIARADRCVGYTPATGVTIDLPEPDGSTLRDGFDPKDQVAVRANGTQATLLLHITACVPPSHWADRFGCAADAFIRSCAAARDTGKAVRKLLDGLTRAAIRQRDVEWLTALLLHSSPCSDTSVEHHLILQAIPEEQRPAVLLRMFRERPEALDRRTGREILSLPESFIVAFSKPWPDGIAIELLPLVWMLAAEGWRGYADESTRATCLVPRALLGRAIDGMSTAPDRHVLVDEMKQLLIFRRDMLDAIDEDA